MFSSTAILIISSVGVLTAWEMQLPASPRGDSHLISVEGYNQVLLVPMGNAGLGAWSDNGLPVPGFPVSSGIGVIQRPSAVSGLSGETLISYADNEGAVHLIDLNGNESSGWPVQSSSNVITSISAVDLNNNGEYSIAFGTSDGQVHLLDLRGLPVQGFPVDLQSQLQYQPTMISLGGGNGNGLICATNNSKLTVLGSDGHDLPGWPQITAYPSGTVPVSGDVNADGQADIVFASQDGKVHLFSLLGQEQDGWPFFMDDRPVPGSPAIGVLDQSLGLPQIAIASIDSTVYLLNGDGSLGGSWRWPNRTDSRPFQPIIAQTEFGPTVIATAHSGTIYGWDAAGRKIDGFPISDPNGTVYPPIAGDLNGDGYNELIVVSPSGKTTAYSLGVYSSSSCMWQLALGDQYNSGSFRSGFIPVAEVEQISGEFSGSIPFSYSVSCSDFTGIMVSYSTDAGYTWNETRNYSEQPGRIVWDSRQDIPLAEERRCLIRITPFSSTGPGEGGSSGLLHIDNNSPPEIHMESIQQMDDSRITLLYAVEDAEGDILQLQGQFSVDGGATWELMSLDRNSLEIEPWFYGEPVVWDAPADLGQIGTEDVRLRIRAADADPGPWYFIDGLQIDDDRLPSAQIITPTTKVSGRVVIGIRLNDPEKNPFDVAYEYSIDGENWSPATVIEDESAGTSRFEFQIVWLSDIDLPEFDCPRVRMRALPYDINTGVAVPSAPFHLDNNSPPSVSISSPSRFDVFRGLVPIRYTLSDNESDSIMLNLEYRMQRSEETWYRAEGVVETGPFGPASYNSMLYWNSSVDLPEVSMLNIDIRLVAVDGDSVRSEIVSPITLENGDLPEVIRAIPSNIDHDRSRVEIAFEVVDRQQRIINLDVQYSTDNGQTWNAATVSGATTALFATSYDNTFTWEYGNDLRGVKGTSILRITPVFEGNLLGRPRFIEQVFR